MDHTGWLQRRREASDLARHAREAADDLSAERKVAENSHSHSAHRASYSGCCEALLVIQVVLVSKKVAHSKDEACSAKARLI